MKKTTLKLSSMALALFLSSIVGHAQQHEKCATDVLMVEQRAKNPMLFEQNRAKIETFTRNYITNNSLQKIIIPVKIPTIVHIINNGEAIGTYPNISDVQIQSAISNLNQAFGHTGVYSSSPIYSNPIAIEFVLAQVKEDGTATNGIERIDVTSKSYGADYNTNGLKGQTTGVDSAVLFKDYYWNPQDYMNIWIVKKIDGVDTGSGASGTLGYATLPTTFIGSQDGLVCQARAFGYNPAYSASNPSAAPGFDFGSSASPSSANGTADHEVGHYLNLYHTFTGDKEGTTCPPVSGTVGTDDDGCADIPPHKRTNSICPADSSTGNSCTGGSNEHIHNFMDYSSDDCFRGFSNDQKNRVDAAVNGPRIAFKSSIAHLPATNTYPAAVVNTVVNTDNSNSSLGIFEVSLNGTTFKSLNAFNDGFYLNRVASQPAVTLVANTAYTLNVKVGVGNAGNNELVDAYIDYNNDGAFAVSERVYQTAAGSGKKNGDTFAINFTTPATGGFINSQKLRMRVISGFDNGTSTLASSFTTDNGNVEDYSVVFNPTLSVASIQVDPETIKVFPNPTNSFINIDNLSSSELKSITIIDTLGKLIFQGSNADKIFVGNLESGIYFLKIKFSNDETIIKRFIKQ